MTRITVDSATIARLRGLGESLEFCDEHGTLLGRFEPDEKSPAFREWLRSVEPGISDAEFKRREERNEGVSTDELLQRLREPR